MVVEKALDPSDNVIGVIVCKLEPHRGGPLRGYIAMLATRQEHRGKGIASKLVRMAVEKMREQDADEVSRSLYTMPMRNSNDCKILTIAKIALETEVDNIPSLRIYENLGFLRTKRLHRYYLNGNPAYRLVLYLKPGIPYKPTYPPEMMPEDGGGGGGDPLHESAGLMSEDLMARQAAQMRIENVEGERHDVMRGPP